MKTEIGGARAFLLSPQNIIWVCAAATLLIAHISIHWFVPTFNPPWTDKPAWIQNALKAELIVHIVFLGAFITAIRNMVPAISSPKYEEDELLDISSEAPVRDRKPRLPQMVLIVCEFSAYLVGWGMAYGLIG